ncbi:cytochrome-c oxidase, cbb3-type subunit III [Massilia arenosa]|uniref:Cbb3-type cytochrome c oxidase subunit n=1 Tax=Zemynaea arenosa TaxID=2561931 RepID=A0A4Y9SBA7_9BURK|nr:cytochrome-c oxidase, cbb3-type subunit III [Massilia arenosa]TFW17484.1 cytochrome-c oxidase, cbb3-type subunit III [Massilia arenosa]
MSDFYSPFWNIYIVVLTVLSILGCGLLLWSQSRIKVSAEEAKKAPDQIGTTGHVWDEDLTELNTPMPRWWMGLFWLTIFFSVAYLVLYPGLGTNKGQYGWSSADAYKKELAAADAEYGPQFAQYLKTDIKVVAADPKAHAMGERLFLTYCSQCHGSDARGNKGFPNLTDTDWLHGGTPDKIKETIMGGRHGQMPVMAGALGSEEDVANVAHYVVSLSGGTADPVKATLGKPKFAACAACHGADGKGMQALGSPNLTDKTWLYGGSVETVMETIRKGRSGTMPAFGDFLGEGKAHVLAAYVWSLSNDPTAKTADTTAAK